MGSVAEGTKFTPMKWWPEPGTFPFGDAEDLDGIGTGFPTIAVREGTQDLLDDVRIGRTRPMSLLGNGISPEDFDPAKVAQVKEDFVRLQQELASDPDILAIQEVRNEALRLVGQIVLIDSFYGFDRDIVSDADQLAFVLEG